MPRLNLTQKFEILAKLREVTRAIPHMPGKCAFNEGWSDNEVATVLGAERKSVVYIRKAEVGELVSRLPVSGAALKEPDIEAIIRDAVAKIIAPVQNQLDNINKVVGALSLAVNEMALEMEARPIHPATIIKSHEPTKTLLGDKLREAAARITNSEA